MVKRDLLLKRNLNVYDKVSDVDDQELLLDKLHVPISSSALQLNKDAPHLS